MKARLPIMLDDPQTSHAGLDLFEEFYSHEEPFFLDGPVSRRVAVLDFDEATGALFPGARFLPPTPRRKIGRYEIPEAGGIYCREFIQVSTFATVLRTMDLFEEPDALGRPLTWAFGAPQLLVVPRAGEGANAFYERESHSLQLFSLSRGSEPPVCAALSRDVIAHETAHAILDGIAPDLYDSSTPQSLALHEAIADLTALLMAFRSGKLRRAVLEVTGGSIRDSTAFSAMAPELGQARGEARYLRSLLNERTLKEDDPGRANRFDPYALSEALSGALYTVMVRIHEDLLPVSASSGKALFVGSERFKRMIFRALDYLPPGDVTFADYGRAILAADQAAHPDDGRERDWIREEFVRRALVSGPAALAVETNFRFPPLQDLDLQTLASSDWAAYEFANRHRDFLRIPEGVPFQVRPRLDTTKSYYLKKGEGPEPIRELIFKVSWAQPKAAGSPLLLPGQKQVTAGTTLALDWKTGEVRARLTSELGGSEELVRLTHSLHAAPGQVTAPPSSFTPIPPPGVDAGAFYDLVERRRTEWT